MQTSYVRASFANFTHPWLFNRDITENRPSNQDGHGGGNASSVATAAIELERQRRNLKAETQQTGQKEKFNFVEEFFICLACIFD